MTSEKRLPPRYDANENKSRDSESDDENIRLSQSRGDPAGANAVFSCLGLFIQILTSTTGLFIINLFFLLLGSYIFYLIEAPKEEALQNNLHSLRETLVDQLIILGHGDAASYDGNASEKLAIYEGHLANFYRKRATLNIDYGNSTTGQTKLWTAYGAIIYCYSIITTIGWGNIVASTLPGRMATIVYGLFGMPLLFTLSTDVGNIVSFCNLKLWHLLKHIYKKIYRLTLNKDHHHHHHHHHHQHGKAGKKDEDDEDDAKSKKTRSSGSLGSGGSKSSLASRGSRSSTVSLPSDSFGGSMDDLSPNRYFSDPGVGEATSLKVGGRPRDHSRGYPRYLNKAKNNAAYLASVESTIDFIMEFSKLKGDADAVYRYPHKRILCKHDAVRLSEKFDVMSVDEIVKCMEFAGFPMEKFETILEDMREKYENGVDRSSISSHTLSDKGIILGQPETVESFENKTKHQVNSDDDHARGDSLQEAKREIADQGGGESQPLNRNDSKPSDRAFQKRTKLTQTTSQLSSHPQREPIENVAKCRDGSTRSCPPATANGPGSISERAGDVLDVKSLTEGHVNPLQRLHNRSHADEARSGPCVGDKGMLRNGRGDGEVTRQLPEDASDSYEGFNETQAKTRDLSKLVSGVRCIAALDGSRDIEMANVSASAATSMVKESEDFEVNGKVSLETKSHGTIEDTTKQMDLTEPNKNVRGARNDKTAVKMGDDLVGSKTKRLAEIFNTVFQVERMGFSLNDPKFNVDNDTLIDIHASTAALTVANLSKHNSLLYDAPPKQEKLQHFAGQRSRVDSTPPKNEDYEFVKKWNIQHKKPQHLRAYPAVLSAAGSNDIQGHVALSSGRKPEAIPKEKQLIDYFVSVAIGEREGKDLNVHSFTNAETKVSSVVLTSKCQVPEQNEKTIDLTSNSPTHKNAEATLQSPGGQSEPQTIASSQEMKSCPARNTIGDPQQSLNLPRILQPFQNKKISLVQGESVNFESVATSDENQVRLQAVACTEIRGKHSNACIDRKASIPGNDSKQPALCEETSRFEGSKAKKSTTKRILRSRTEEMKSRFGRVKVHDPQPMDYNQSADEEEMENQAKRDILEVMMKKKKQYLARAIDEEDDEEEDEDDTKKDDGNQAEDYHLPLLVLYAFVIMYVLIGSTVYYTLSYDSSFTFLDAIYFIYVLLSTTGFGDILPELHMYYFSAVYGLLGMAIFNVLINATLETLLSALDYINAIAVAVDNDDYFDDASGSETSYD